MIQCSLENPCQICREVELQSLKDHIYVMAQTILYYEKDQRVFPFDSSIRELGVKYAHKYYNR